MIQSFKPCYKWNAFNTRTNRIEVFKKRWVLNLIISGIPSILKEFDNSLATELTF